VLIEDLHLMGNSRSFYLAAIVSLGYLVLQVVPIYALMRGYELDLSLAPAFVVLVIWRLSTVLPQAPGNIGTSQAALAIGLGLFGVDKTTAAGLSMMTWGVITLPLLVAGFLALAMTGTNLGEIHYHARKHGLSGHAIATESQPAK
jgi:glycosyltransferase 2 family protein